MPVSLRKSVVAAALSAALLSPLLNAPAQAAGAGPSGPAAESSGSVEPAGEFASLPWQRGPASGPVGSRSTLTIPAGTALLPESHGSRFLELTGNLPQSGRTILASKSWWAVFKFVDDGYVKDDEKIDANALLATLKASDGPANEERRRRGMTELTTVGWHVPPHYDPNTRFLEWGLALRSSGSSEQTINYTVKMLGRRGHETVTLVSSPDTLDKDVAEFKAALKGFQFNAGERYAEFKQGDKVAAYGLGALVLGGAAAVATKKGFWAGLVGALLASKKLLIGLGVAVLAGLGKLFGRNKD